MATFRFRSNRWQARVRRLGYPDETRSFLMHQEAERWARTVKPGIEHQLFKWPLKLLCEVSAAFERAAERASLADLHFHDSRHTAITQMADKLPKVIELAAVSGHESLKMLQRYYHPSPQTSALKFG
jgi:integrase